jgi:hypothetical protein
MYWGPWIIWKNLNKNGGYPIQIYSTSGSYTFKWKSGKYKGEELSKSIILSNQKKNTNFILSDFLPLNTIDKVKKLLVNGGCEGITTSTLIGGIDMYKTEQLTKEFPHCFKKPSKTLSKTDPLYNEKIKMSDFKETDKYGIDIESFKNMDDQSDDQLLARYKSGVIDNLYDLIYIPELGKKNYESLINDLKYSKNIVRLGLKDIVLSEKDKKTPYGYKMFKSALLNIKRLKNKFGWVGDDSVVLDEYGLDPNFLSSIPLTTAIDPSYIEGVLWVKAKKRLIQLLYESNKIEKELELSFENSERFKNGLNPKKPNEVSLKEKPEIKLPNGKIIKIPDYKQRLEKFVTSELNKKLLGYDFFKNTGEEEIRGYDQIIRLIYSHNKNIAEQKSEWINSCTNNIYVPDQGLATKTQLEKSGGPGCSNKLYGKITVKDICKNKNMGGVFIFHSEMKERKNISGFNFSS